jgi:plastocyanin
MPRLWVSGLVFAFTTCHIASSVSAQAGDASFTSGVPIAAAATPSATASAASNKPQVHIIKAGAGGFKFEPQQITDVAVGDIVSFEFYPPDHSVARAEFGSACVPYEYSHKDKKGFWSGTQLVDTVAEVRKNI